MLRAIPPVAAGTDEATKLTVYLGRQERVYRVPAFVAVCDLLHRRGIAGATALLGVDGTAHGRRERAAFFGRNADVPMMIIAVGAGEQIGRVLPELGALLRRPLITLERVRVCKRDGRLGAAAALPGTTAGAAGRSSWSTPRRRSGTTASRSTARSSGGCVRPALGGATTLRGIWGFHGDHAPHGDRLLQLGRHVPTVTDRHRHPRAHRRGVTRSSTSSPASAGWSPARPSAALTRPGCGPRLVGERGRERRPFGCPRGAGPPWR